MIDVLLTDWLHLLRLLLGLVTMCIHTLCINVPHPQACLPRLQPHLRSLRRVHLLRLLLALQEAGCTPPADFMAQLTTCLQVGGRCLGGVLLRWVFGDL